ncbi:sulfatase [Lentisphaera araneosa HTCC2155]|uniref:Sulfatase n=1 Tax=Lentisphaera araneosa HTCC2155 TaxID=313628 RepID=A6DKC6_9BACT|nr:arylsulfatase [Lentisphaera araneosa]EDM27824.1 sulfatase [Lentisphaera araneosa HTCC2155]
MILNITLSKICLAIYLCFNFAIIANERPNIVLVLADDLGPGDISYFHQQRTSNQAIIQTPALDKLRADGMHFTNAHSPASLCAPTRFSMLTGNYSFRNYSAFGVWMSHRDTGIDPKFTTSARIAKQASYRTAFFGKWGLGGQMYQKGSDKIHTGWKTDAIDYSRRAKGPNDYGFDYSCELPQGIQGEPFAFYENQKWMPLHKDSILKKLSSKQLMYDKARKHNDLEGVGDSFWDPREAGGVLVNKAINFIKDHKKSHSDQAFFMYYCSQAVHIPHTAPEELNGVKIAGSTPGKHGDMIVELDVQIAMLRKALENNGFAENTLFIFTSDNGGLKPDQAMSDLGHDSSNGWRGIKSSVFEGGHLVPFIAVWPGKIKKASQSNAFVVAHDAVATVSAVVGEKLDRSVVMDSKNLLPIFLNKEGASGHKYLFHQSQLAKKKAAYAIREGDWKLIMHSSNQKNLNDLKAKSLFNLATNPQEEDKKNLITNPEYSQIKKQLLKKFIEVRKLGQSLLTD